MYTGYLGVNTQYLIEQLIELYINIALVNLGYNKIQIEDPINPSQLINLFFERVDDCVQYTTNKDTICIRENYPDRKSWQWYYTAMIPRCGVKIGLITRRVLPFRDSL